MMPLFWIAAAFITGLLLEKQWQIPLWAWLTVGGVSLFLFGLQKILWHSKWFEKLRRLLFVSPFLLFFFLALGGLRMSLAQPNWNEHDLPWYNERGTYQLVAVVDRSPDVREDFIYLHLSVREVYDPATMHFSQVQGAALARLPRTAQWQLGDLLRMTATPRTPSEAGDFSYRAYLEHQGIYTIIYYPTSVQQLDSGQAGVFAQTLETVRQVAAKTIYCLFPQPESGLLEGILLGNDNNLPPITAQAYRDTGTAHIIAISGFNMAILAAIFSALFTKLTNRYWSLPLTGLVLIVYTLFVGASPAVLRAAIMAILAFGGHLIGRKNSGLNALGLTAGAMCLFNPQLPWDVSFQLSFAATLGLMLFADPLQGWLKALLSRRLPKETSNRLTGPLSEYFLFTLAAQVTTLPVILLQFSRLSLTSLLANPLVLPVQPAVLVGGMLTTLLGMVWLPLGQLAALFTWPLLAYSNWIVTLLARIHGGAMTLSAESAIAFSILAMLLVLLFLFRKMLHEFFKNFRWIYAAVGLFLLAFVLWLALWRAPDGRLHLRLLRSEDESSLLLTSPGGYTLLIDPASESNALAAALSPALSPWNFHLDAALATDLAAARNILELNDRLPVDEVILAPPAYLIGQEESAAILPASAKVKKLSDTESIHLEDDLTVLPLAVDLHHTALLIRYGEVKILIPGGASPGQLLVYKESELAGLNVLILNEDDIEYLPADMWQNLGAQTILWNSPSLSPDPSWLGLDEYSAIEIISNGSGIALKTQP